jgi:hypothetical protein
MLQSGRKLPRVGATRKKKNNNWSAWQLRDKLETSTEERKHISTEEMSKQEQR